MKVGRGSEVDLETFTFCCEAPVRTWSWRQCVPLSVANHVTLETGLGTIHRADRAASRRAQAQRSLTNSSAKKLWDSLKDANKW